MLSTIADSMWVSLSNIVTHKCKMPLSCLNSVTIISICTSLMKISPLLVTSE
jgi:hypothetical protein